MDTVSQLHLYEVSPEEQKCYYNIPKREKCQNLAVIFCMHNSTCLLIFKLRQCNQENIQYTLKDQTSMQLLLIYQKISSNIILLPEKLP